MTSDETFRYDPTPMNHAFPGQPDDCFDMVNQYGTYEIQRTADTGNFFPAIAQGLPLTDDCSAMEAAGRPVRLTPGDVENLKITTPVDLRIAEAIWKGRTT